MSTSAQTLSSNENPTALPPRRSGWLLVASFPVFAAGVVALSVNIDRFKAEDAAAKRLDVSVHDLPGDALGPIAQEHSSLPMEAALIAPTIVAFALFVAGIWLATSRAGGWGTLARTAGAVAAIGWVACMGLFLTLFANDGTLPWVRDHFPTLVKSTTAVSVIAGCMAVIALASVLRGLDIARRTGLVVTAIAALVVVLAPIPAAGGMPPIVSCLLAMVLGIPVIRARARA